MRRQWEDRTIPRNQLIKSWRCDHRTAKRCMREHGTNTGQQSPDVAPESSPAPDSVPEAQAIVVASPRTLALSADLPANYTRAQAEDVFRVRLSRLVEEADSFLEDTKAHANLDVRAKALKSYRELVELLGKHLGLFAPTTAVQINLTQSDEWQKVRGALLDALDPYPDAMAAVVAAIERTGVR